MEQQAKKIWIFDSTLRDGAQGEGKTKLYS